MTKTVVFPPETHARFWEKVDQTGDCWDWMASRNSKGYGAFYVKHKGYYAHRLSYIFAGGQIPSGYQIDHLCRRPSCVRPDHLEAVTPAENTRRGDLFDVLRQKCALITHCPKGHAYDAANTIYAPPGRRRQCRACHNERHKRRYWLRKAAKIQKAAEAA